MVVTEVDSLLGFSHSDCGGDSACREALVHYFDVNFVVVLFCEDDVRHKHKVCVLAEMLDDFIHGSKGLYLPAQ